MADSTPGTPSWLERSHNTEHISTVLRTLARREKSRSAARDVSRHQSNPSRRHRVAHFASSVSANPEHVTHYAVTAGTNPDNEVYNRYADIHPYDRTRVLVCGGEPGHGCPDSCSSGRYMNANWVRELAGGKWWIATQAPLPHTSHAFLSVFLEGVSPPPDSSLRDLRNLSRVRTVVQLTQNLERGRRKAHVYFPPIEGQSWIIEPEPGSEKPPIDVTLTRSHTVDNAHCIHSVVTIQALSPDRTPLGEPVIFQHLLYASWPDHGVPAPEDREGLLRFARLVDEANRDRSLYAGSVDLDPDPPIMVNCSAGVGRTGAFIALCSLLRKYRLLSPPRSHVEEIPPLPASPLGPLPEELQEDLVALEVDSLREQRPGMVQRDDQVVMVYETLIAAFAMSSAG